MSSLQTENVFVSTELGAAAFYAAPVAIALVDHGATLLACNHRFLQLVRRSDRELLGSSLEVLLQDEDASQLLFGFRRLIRGSGSGYETTGGLVRGGGDVVAVRISVQVERRCSPPRAVVVIEEAPLGVTVSSGDRAEERYRSLVENTTDLVTVVDADGRVVYQSPAVTRSLGWTPEEVASSTAFELMHPDDRPRCEAAFARLVRDRVPVTMTYRVRHKEGPWHYVEATGSNLLHDPSVGGVVVHSRDVTERQLAQESLRQAEENYRALIEQLPLVVYATAASDDGNVLYISPQVVELLGYSLAQWQSGRGLWETLLHPDDRERVLAEIARQRGASDRIKVEYRMVARDGRVVWVIDDMVLLRDADGQPRHYQGFLLDITERETLHEQLRHSQRLEALGRIAAGVAHDFNNVLMSVAGYAELASVAIETGDTDRVCQGLDRIQTSAERGRDLTRKLLAFGRNQVLQEEVIDVALILAEAGALLERVLGDQISVIVERATDRCSVHVDQAQLEQLLMNLATNARDAMPDGGTLTLAVSERDVPASQALRAGRYVVIEIADTGTGMDETTLARVFEPFFTTKAEGKGTGLGLASAHGFVRQSGGDIRVESSPGRGTLFEISLPAAPRVVTNAAPAAN